jgi:hypothetical protein
MHFENFVELLSMGHGHSLKTPCFQSEWGIAGMQPQLQQEIMFKRDILHAGG